ncbi:MULTISPECIES: STAS domain-containing protein [Kitasatospora]|uniref:MlaB-like STAS domain-containing protein n=1 Tax=Kitasatospora cystarginea TaxID=58350 RepID=A0ABP5QXV2_9ACTN
METEETQVLVLVARPGAADWDRLYGQLRESRADGPRVVECDVSAFDPADGGALVVVGGLARLQLTARRGGREIRLRGAGRELLELLELTGLGEQLPPR